LLYEPVSGSDEENIAYIYASKISKMFFKMIDKI
jgi:hypothetical protein